MIAAIYARKSTEQRGVADEDRSVARQVEHARMYAAKQGWIVADEHVYVDDGISGAEFEKRPGFLRLLNSIKRRRAPFDALIVSELSRLGREQLETGYALKQLAQARVRIFSYLEDREVVLESPTDKFLMSAVNFAAELEREKARQRTHDGLMRKALAGHVTGGRVFGYDNVPIYDASGRRTHTERKINEREARSIRRIFELCAEGFGKAKIARLLNDEGALAPQPRCKQRSARFPQGWAQTSVHEVLHRPLYKGHIVWNRERKRDQWGQRAMSKRPESEHVCVRAAALAIVDEALWNAAHARLDETRSAYLRATHGRLWGKPLNSVDAKYLLTGLAECVHCGGTLDVQTRGHGSRGARASRKPFYSCSTHRRRGAGSCPGLVAPVERANEAVLTYFEKRILDPERLRRVYEQMLADPYGEGDSERKARLTERRAELSTEISRLADAIASGGGSLQALRDGIRLRELEAKRLDRELEALDRPTLPRGQVLARLDGLVRDWRAMLAERNPSQARQLIRRLIRRRLVFDPAVRDGQKGFRVLGQPTDEPLIAVAVADGGVQAVASPTGTADRWQLPVRGFSDLAA